MMSDKELEKELQKIINEGMINKIIEKIIPAQALIGKGISQLRGKAEGRKINEMLTKKLNEKLKEGYITIITKQILNREKNDLQLHEKKEIIEVSTRTDKIVYVIYPQEITVEDISKDLQEKQEEYKNIKKWAIIIPENLVSKAERFKPYNEPYIVEWHLLRGFIEMNYLPGAYSRD